MVGGRQCSNAPASPGLRVVGPGEAGQRGQTTQTLAPGKSSEVAAWWFLKPCSPSESVLPCWVLPAETQPCGSTDLCLRMSAGGGWMLLVSPCRRGSGLQEANLEGAATHRNLRPLCISQDVALPPATLQLLLPCPLSVSGVKRSLCCLFLSQFLKKQTRFAVEAIQDMSETAGSAIWHLGERGPICSFSHRLLPGSSARGRDWGQEQAGEGKKNTQGNYLRDFDFCTNLALKRAQLSLHLSTSASNYVKKNIIVLLTLMLVVSSRDR